MTSIKAKSGILSWGEDNVNNTPSVCGVFILRISPTADSIVLIISSNNLHDDLLSRMNDPSFSEIKFFDWYSTETIEEAKLLAENWVSKYMLES